MSSLIRRRKRCETHGGSRGKSDACLRKHSGIRRAGARHTGAAQSPESRARRGPGRPGHAGKTPAGQPGWRPLTARRGASGSGRPDSGEPVSGKGRRKFGFGTGADITNRPPQTGRGSGPGAATVMARPVPAADRRLRRAGRPVRGGAARTGGGPWRRTMAAYPGRKPGKGRAGPPFQRAAMRATAFAALPPFGGGSAFRHLRTSEEAATTPRSTNSSWLVSMWPRS